MYAAYLPKTAALWQQEDIVMSRKLTPAANAFIANHLSSGQAPEQQPVFPYVFTIVGLADFATRIGDSKTPPFTLSKPVNGQPARLMPTNIGKDFIDFLSQSIPYIHQLASGFAGHTAHPSIQSLLEILNASTLLTCHPAENPYLVRDVERIFSTVRTTAKSPGFQQAVTEWKDKYQATSKDVRQVLQRRAKTHLQRIIFRFILGWHNQAGLPVQVDPVHTNNALVLLPPAGPLNLKLVQEQMQALTGAIEHEIAPHCFLDVIWHPVQIPFSGYRTYLTLILDGVNPGLDTATILNGIIQSWCKETAPWAGSCTVVNRPQEWTFDRSGASFFVPSHHYCGSGLVSSNDPKMCSELNTQLVQFTCASQQFISLLHEPDMPVIGIRSRSPGLSCATNAPVSHKADAD